VWDDINVKMCNMRSHSTTSAVEKVFEDHEAKLGEYVRRLACVQG